MWEERVAAATQARGTITTMTAAAAAHTAAVPLNLMTMVAAIVNETLPETPVGLPLSHRSAVSGNCAAAINRNSGSTYAAQNSYL
jgi:hypothetical protein